jgi:hypothetical protein
MGSRTVIHPRLKSRRRLSRHFSDKQFWADVFLALVARSGLQSSFDNCAIQICAAKADLALAEFLDRFPHPPPDEEIVSNASQEIGQAKGGVK